MAENRKIYRLLRKNFLLLSLFLLSSAVQAQVFPENPPSPVKVEVRNSRFLNFGSFTAGTTGGTVTVDFDGTRTATGDVFLLNLGNSPSSALFDLTANPGTLVSITVPAEFSLDGDGGTGGQLRLEINMNHLYPGQSFITTALPPSTNEILVGGTLYVGNDAQNPAGFYSGTFSLIFNYE